MNYFRMTILVLYCTFLFVEDVVAQENPSEKGTVYVDEKGVMRWETGEAVEGFGVNYSVPFAHAYRTGQKLGVDLKKAIDEDVYHFSRLGFDLYRIHVWDTEISDEQGNLLENEHQELFDYLIKKLKERNITFVLTPIAFWGNGWPEPDEDTPGFSDKFGKEKSLTEPEAIKAQQNYLAQFMEHVNPYTGVAYKDEPNLIGVEISNEPHHRGTAEEVEDFINKMVAAVRSTGTEKPVFYNVSHSVHLAPAYAEADIDGGTFQWYPTGLGFGQELEGNLLPNVNDYRIPFDSLWRKEGLAKLVYEFDAADVMKSYIYPAMARSFREAGIQFATHFAYDPTYMAHVNTEYNTHYMNLAYTPQKALALMISGEVFHQLPLYADTGNYPENLTFGDFRVSYEEDLAELNSEEKFYYTNTTSSSPENVNKLKHIAGFGDSEVVQYDGKGAYFLDKIEEGVWRLELMPDAILVDNPFGTNSLEKTVAVINDRPWAMKIDLPALGEDFSISGLNEGNDLSAEASSGKFVVEPGAYLITAEGKNFSGSEEWTAAELSAYVAPESTVDKTYVIHEPIPEIAEGSEMSISAEIVSDEKIEKVEAWLQNGNTYKSIELLPTEGYTYEAEVPQELLKKGFLEYPIIVYTGDGSQTFPSGMEGNPGEWDFFGNERYITRIVGKETPLYLFNAATDSEEIVGKWTPGLNLVPTGTPREAEYQVQVEELFEEDIENLNAEPIYDYSFRYNFQDNIDGRRDALAEKDQLVLKARTLKEEPVKLQVALVEKNGSAFGKIVELQPQTEEIVIDLDDLEPVKTVTLPRPYPTFLQYYFEHELDEDFDVEAVESIQFSIGPGLEAEQLEQPQGVGIISVKLQ